MSNDNPYCQCLFYSANALARVMTKMADDAFKKTGLAPSHAFVLMTVIRTPGIQPTRISKIMMLTPSTVTRLIEKLESKKLVIRETAGKATRVIPTAAGRKLESVLQSSWLQLYDAYTRVLGKRKSVDVTSAMYEAAVVLEKAT
jgi:DNA-binding MarR family transcriptional regulator